MISEIDAIRTALEIVKVLHKNKIPIASMQAVFDKARKFVENNTLPPNPESFYEWDELISHETAIRGFLADKSNGGTRSRIVFTEYGKQNNI